MGNPEQSERSVNFWMLPVVSAARADQSVRGNERIESLTLAQAETLVATTQGSRLSVGGLQTLSPAVATALAAFDRTALELTPELARTIAAFKGPSLGSTG